MEIKKLLSEVILLAKEAGREILKYYKTDFAISAKEDNSPVTIADLASHQIIITSLNQLTPDIPVLSEESASISFEERKKWRTYWLIDPLDGTKEFIEQNDEFTINIALIDNCLPMLGVLYAPALKTIYFAAKNCGAYKQIAEESPQKIQTKVFDQKKLTIACSRHHAIEKLNELVSSNVIIEKITRGSALKFGLVAEGSADFYPRLGPTSEWDTAAGQCIVEEAGGYVLNLQGEKLTYNQKDSLINASFLVVNEKAILQFCEIS